MEKLFYNGTILTLTSPLYAESMVTDGNQIIATGSLSELKQRFPNAKRIDLDNHCLMPAFIDAHSHLSQLAMAQMQISLDGVSNVEEMKQRIQAYIQSEAPEKGTWLTARDYDNNLFPGAQNPTLDEIDSFAPGYKLIIHHKSGHMGLFNSEALEFLEIKNDTPAPEGGKYGHTDGMLNGYMEENAFFTAIKKMPMASIEEMMAAYQKAQDIYASYGISWIQEGMVVPEMLPLYEQLLKRDLIKLDLTLYCSIETVEPLKALLKKYPGRIHLGGIKIFLDGSPQGRTAWMRTPYIGGDGTYCGYNTMTDEQVLKSFQYAGQNHLQLIAHCNGDAAAAQFLRCLELAEKDYPQLKKLRPVIIHGQLMGRDQLKKVKELGATVSFFVAHVRHWGDVHIKNFGLQRASYISAVATAMKLNIPCTFHQDTPVLPPDMLETISIAVQRKTAAGVQLAESERLPVLEAVKAVTVNAAWQYFQENQRGRLEPGKAADFVVLSNDPLNTDPAKIENIKVLSLYKDGKAY